jgi:hypothetical protein
MISPTSHRALRAYAGLKLVLSTAILFVSLLCALVLLARHITFDTQSTLAGTMRALFQYGVHYWSANAILSLVLALGLALVGFCNGAKPLVTRYLGLPLPDIHVRRRIAAFNRIANFELVLIAVQAFYLIPLIALRYGGLVLGASMGFSVVGAIFAQAGLVGFPSADRRRITSLARHKFTLKSFNVAALSTQSAEATEDLGTYKQACEKGARSEAAEQFLRSGGAAVHWRGNDSFIRKLGEFLHVEPRKLRLFHATTEAVEHATREIQAAWEANKSRKARRRRRLLCSDADYPAISRHREAFCADHKVVPAVASILEDLWSGADDDSLCSRYLEAGRAVGGFLDVVMLLGEHLKTGQLRSLQNRPVEGRRRPLCNGSARRNKRARIGDLSNTLSIPFALSPAVRGQLRPPGFTGAAAPAASR